MLTTPAPLPSAQRRTRVTDYDAVIAGAAFAGLRVLYELRDRLGLSVKAFEAGSDVGGTWYWNRYPGARTDTESWAYCMFFDKEFYEQWEWSERYPPQPEVLAHLKRVAERHDLYKNIEFNTRVEAATWDEANGIWTITTDHGVEVTARYFIAATGLLSIPLEPPFPGLSSFKGECYLTARWPHHAVTFEGKRVAVIGTGASGVQIAPVIAHTAERLFLFQRTANYVLPARNVPLDEEWRKELMHKRDEIYAMSCKQLWGFPMEDSTTRFADCETDEERRFVLDRAWEAGGFRFLFQGFVDMWVDEEAARFTQEFVHDKIRKLVKDPETAELLCPRDHRLGAKRPPLGHHYYEMFNRENVTLVDIKANAIEAITPGGLRLAGGEEYELDMIVLATGFDGMVGPLISMDVRGCEGETLRDRLTAAADTYLGIAIDGFPNMFTMTGPKCPGGNIPTTVDIIADLVGKAITHMSGHGYDVIEAQPEALQQYVAQCRRMVEPAVLWKDGVNVRSWLIGANVPGRQPAPLFWFGGMELYTGLIRQVIDHGFEGFAFRSPAKVYGRLDGPPLEARGNVVG
jgi:cation diffusion facilitator CzcD-associated flavoprotein CzcO